jgi:hypothetical protein
MYVPICHFIYPTKFRKIIFDKEVYETPMMVYPEIAKGLDK